MRSPEPTRARRSTAAAPRARRTTAALLAALAATLLALPTSAGATPPRLPRLPQATSDDLDKLNKQVAELEKKYGGDLALLRDTQTVAKEALTRSTAAQKNLDDARRTVAQLAAAEYMKTPLDPMTALFAERDPSVALDRAALAGHVLRSRQVRAAQLGVLVEQQKKAVTDAQGKIAALRQGLKDMDARRVRLKALIDKYKPQSPLEGADNLTPRMVTVRTEVDKRFGPFPTIGCYRPGDPQDHGSGRACDFMESSGGVMPTAARQAHGDQVAQWAIDNAAQYGIKYIIWKQRIYDLRSPGWKGMSDRGGITANHYDHVHISVF